MPISLRNYSNKANKNTKQNENFLSPLSQNPTISLQNSIQKVDSQPMKKDLLLKIKKYLL